MKFTAKIQRTIHAPVDKVWASLTLPALVKQYFFGSNLSTDWVPGHPIFFRGEWEGKPYEDKGTVLRFVPEKMLQYDYFSSWSSLKDSPENHQRITYRVQTKGASTVLTVVQDNIDTLENKVHSAQNWKMMLETLKNLLESKSL